MPRFATVLLSTVFVAGGVALVENYVSRRVGLLLAFTILMSVIVVQNSGFISFADWLKGKVA